MAWQQAWILLNNLIFVGTWNTYTTSRWNLDSTVFIFHVFHFTKFLFVRNIWTEEVYFSWIIICAVYISSNLHNVLYIVFITVFIWNCQFTMKLSFYVVNSKAKIWNEADFVFEQNCLFEIDCLLDGFNVKFCSTGLSTTKFSFLIRH